MSTGLIVSGLGFRVSDIKEILDARKVLATARKQCPNLDVGMKSQYLKFSEYKSTDNAGRIHILESYLNLYSQGLAGLFIREDHQKLLCVSVEPKSGDTSLLYPPRFPWRMREQEMTSEPDAIRYICGIVLSFARRVGNSYVFWGNEAAVAIYELADSFQSIHTLISDSERNGLMTIIKTHFRPYYTAIREMPGGKGVIY